MLTELESPFRVYRRLLNYLAPFRLPFFIAIFGNILYGIVDAGLIKLLQPLLDEGFGARNQSFIRWIPPIVLGVFFFRGLANFCASHFMGWVSRQIVMTIRQQMFLHLLQLPATFFDRHNSGELLSKITYDVEQVANASTEAIEVVVREVCTAVGLLLVMLSISWELTLFFLLTVPFMSVIMRFASRRLRAINQKVQASMGGVTQIVQEAIDGHKEIKTYGGQSYERQRFFEQTQYNRRQEMKVITTSSISVPMVQLIGAAALAGTIYFASLAPLQNGHMVTAGAFAAMVTAMMALLKPIKQLTKINTTIQRGIAAASSIFVFLDEPIEMVLGHMELGRAQGSLELRDVSFSYATHPDRYVLKDINLSVLPGQVVAIVGRSGGGKTSLVQLLPRFYEAEGTILLDGVEIQQWSLANLRQQFAIVSQHVTLFNDTIFNNIAYGQLDQSPENVVQAATMAYADTFICELPEGYQTVIGENGVRLSGGQRQRLAIARAILKKAPILILDEATSALDSDSEKYIQLALSRLMKQATTLVIAHRLSTIERADKIIVIEHGRVVEEGTHQELCLANGLYAELLRAQSLSFTKADHGSLV